VAGQLALADFIARGELERHLRRMRLRYQQRGATLVAALARELPDWRASTMSGGLHLAIALPDYVDEPPLLSAAARHGIGLEGLSLHSYTGDCPPGLVFGHAYMPEPAIERGVELLAKTAARTSE
jgi:GntR family transcriptional regulator / MocR family aminotransferase